MVLLVRTCRTISADVRRTSHWRNDAKIVVTSRYPPFPNNDRAALVLSFSLFRPDVSVSRTQTMRYVGIYQYSDTMETPWRLSGRQPAVRLSHIFQNCAIFPRNVPNLLNFTNQLDSVSLHLLL